MFFITKVLLLLLASHSALAASLSQDAAVDTRAARCSSRQRLAGAKQIPYAYNLKAPGASAAAFEKVPFTNNCSVFLNANGAPAVQVANNAASTRDFALETRQLFSKVTGRYTDFKNGTTIIHTNVTLGAAHSIPVPVTFSANVYLTYDLVKCQIYKVQAFATIPSRILGKIINPPKVVPSAI